LDDDSSLHFISLNGIKFQTIYKYWMKNDCTNRASNLLHCSQHASLKGSFSRLKEPSNPPEFFLKDPKKRERGLGSL
jgi:hypothetical protein